MQAYKSNGRLGAASSISLESCDVADVIGLDNRCAAVAESSSSISHRRTTCSYNRLPTRLCDYSSHI